jgi:hypothetical protein
MREAGLQFIARSLFPQYRNRTLEQFFPSSRASNEFTPPTWDSGSRPA